MEKTYKMQHKAVKTRVALESLRDQEVVPEALASGEVDEELTLLEKKAAMFDAMTLADDRLTTEDGKAPLFAFVGKDTPELYLYREDMGKPRPLLDWLGKYLEESK